MCERSYQRWAHNSTCDRIVHKMPIETPEWQARREQLGEWFAAAEAYGGDLFGSDEETS